MGGMLCTLLLIASGCSGGLQVPQVNLSGWAYSPATRAARQQVAARIAAAIAALRSAHLSVSVSAAEDFCSRWEDLQGNGAVTEWGVQCVREEDVFGGFGNDPAAELAVIQRSLKRSGWDDWTEFNPQCGNYSRGNHSQLLGSFSFTKAPSATAAGGSEIRADVDVGPASGPAADGNISYILGCIECGPDARPDANYLGGIPPFYYVQHTCPRSSAIENAVAGQAGIWHVAFNSGYVGASTFGSSPPTQSPG
jgi:hypothetical protein